jgi:hypothetical protein
MRSEKPYLATCWTLDCDERLDPYLPTELMTKSETDGAGGGTTRHDLWQVMSRREGEGAMIRRLTHVVSGRRPTTDRYRPEGTER